MDQATPSEKKEVQMVERKGQRGMEELWKQPTRYSENNKKSIGGELRWVRGRENYISNLKRVYAPACLEDH
jgi:hypothetical protein